MNNIGENAQKDRKKGSNNYNKNESRLHWKKVDMDRFYFEGRCIAVIYLFN